MTNHYSRARILSLFMTVSAPMSKRTIRVCSGVSGSITNKLCTELSCDGLIKKQVGGRVEWRPGFTIKNTTKWSLS